MKLGEIFFETLFLNFSAVKEGEVEYHLCAFLAIAMED
jgi:hypothetical protein